MDTRRSTIPRQTGSLEPLFTEMLGDPHGEFSTSIYETGRLVALTPSLAGHNARLRFLLDHQRPDGTWGGPDGYCLVPTLSAAHGLLHHLDTGTHAVGVAREELLGALGRCLPALAERLRHARELPDTAAIEIIVPGLVGEINTQLGGGARHRRDGQPGHAAPWSEELRLPLPPGLDADQVDRLRERVADGAAPPPKLWHSLEVVGAAAQGAAFVTPAGGGVGCSPAATAAWLGDQAVRANQHPCVGYLRNVQNATGAVPVAAPLGFFERAWVASTLAAVGMPVPDNPDLIRELHAAFDESGAGGGPGLPPDADSTSGALYALALLGSPRSPECLLGFRENHHFSCYPAERTPSVTANAHVLEAFGACLATGYAEPSRHGGVIGEVAGWLRSVQHDDGSWFDKWHASPYYATKCCVRALARYGGPPCAGALRAAARWVLEEQRADGSWGRWFGTYEETAYAVQILAEVRRILDGPPEDAPVMSAIARGCAYLHSSADEPYPPLWHDKDLYTPVKIVRAEGWAALRLANEVAGDSQAAQPGTAVRCWTA